MDWGKRFPSLRRNLYFASCSQGPMSVDVLEAVKSYLSSIVEEGNPWDEWMKTVYEAAACFGEIVQANEEEICPHYSASSALISLISSFTPGRRNKVVTTELDYPSIGVPLAALKKRGFDVEIIRAEQGLVDVEKFRKKVDEKTLLVATFHVSALNGYMQDVKALSEICEAKGAYFLLDAYQSIGAVPIDVKKMGVDFLVAGTTKFLLGIPGAGFLYARKDIFDDLEPTAVSWFSQRDPFLFGPEDLDYRDDAKRFEMGTWSVVSMYAARAGMRLIMRVGVDSIWRRIMKTRNYFVEEVEDAGFQMFSPDLEKIGPTVSLFFGQDSSTVERRLRSKRVIVSARGPGVRFAHHFFNNREQVDRVVEILRKHFRRN